MEFFEDGDEIVSTWHPESRFESWSNTLHGGIQALLLDEICGWTIMRKLQTAGVTSRMTTKYRKPVSTSNDRLTLRSSIVERCRNVVTVEARIYNEAGELCTEAEAVYFCMSREKAASEMGFCGCETEE